MAINAGIQQLNYLFFLSVPALETLANFLSTAYESSASTTRMNKIYCLEMLYTKVVSFYSITADIILLNTFYIIHFINKTA
jgi:hypothetical protein